MSKISDIADAIKKAKLVKPTIDLDDDPATQIDKTLNALKLANDPPHLFRRGRAAARVRPYQDEPTEIESLGSDALFAEVTRTVDFIREGKKKHRTTHYPPEGLMRALRGCGELPYPPLNGLRNAPFFTAKGELVTVPGYHIGSGIFYAPDTSLTEMAAIPLSPSSDDVMRASELLRYPIHQFPFADDASYAHAIALALLPFLREMVSGPVPIFAVSAPTPRQGKDKLVLTLCAPALGCEAPEMPEIGKGEELRKRLTSLVLANEPIAFFANVNHVVAGGALAAILTASTWSDRILGRSEMVKLPVRNAWIVSANNPRFSAELLLRTLLIRLDANTEHPGRRIFHEPTNPIAYSLTHRGELVWASVVLIQNWIAKGKPKAELSARLGGFDSFTEVMGGILGAAGTPGFLGNLKEFQADPASDAEQWRPFITQWWVEHKDKAVSPSALLAIADQTDFARPPAEKETERARVIKFGQRIAGHIDRVFDILPDGDAEAKSVKIMSAEYEREGGRKHRGYKLGEPKTVQTAKDTAPDAGVSMAVVIENVVAPQGAAEEPAESESPEPELPASAEEVKEEVDLDEFFADDI